MEPFLAPHPLTAATTLRYILDTSKKRRNHLCRIDSVDDEQGGVGAPVSRPPSVGMVLSSSQAGTLSFYIFSAEQSICTRMCPRASSAVVLGRFSQEIFSSRVAN